MSKKNFKDLLVDSCLIKPRRVSCTIGASVCYSRTWTDREDTYQVVTCVRAVICNVVARNAQFKIEASCCRLKQPHSLPIARMFEGLSGVI